MIKSKFTGIIFLLLVMCSYIVSAQNKKATPNSAEVTFKVNMHCEGCKTRIEKTIPFEKGVKDLTVNLDLKTVKVIYNPTKTNESKIKKAFEDLEYTCSRVEPDSIH